MLVSCFKLSSFMLSLLNKMNRTEEISSTKSMLNCNQDMLPATFKVLANLVTQQHFLQMCLIRRTGYTPICSQVVSLENMTVRQSMVSWIFSKRYFTFTNHTSQNHIAVLTAFAEVKVSNFNIHSLKITSTH